MMMLRVVQKHQFQESCEVAITAQFKGLRIPQIHWITVCLMIC